MPRAGFVTSGALRVSSGLLGAACMSAGGYAYARMPRRGVVVGLDALRDVRAWPAAEWAGVSLCFAGVLLLTVAWLLLGLAVRRRLAGVVDVNRATLLWSLPLLVAPPLFSGDAWSYAADGFLTGHGISPYLSPPAVLHGPIVQAVCRCWRHTLAPYGPVPLLWGGAFSRLTSNPWLLMLAYRLLALVGLALLMYAAPRLARVVGARPSAASWLAVASPFVLADGIGGAHVDLLIAGLVCTALLLTVTRGWLAGALLVGVATGVKAPAVVAGLGVLLLTARSGALLDRLRSGLRVGATALGTAVGIGVVSGLGVGWVRTMQVALVLHTPLSLTFDGGRALRTVLPRDAPSVADAVGVAVLAVGCVVLLARTPVGEPRAPVTAAGVAMLLVTVFSPVTNYWYYLWCLPLLACCPLPLRARRCLVAFVAVLGVLAPLDPSLHLPDSWAVAVGSVGAALLLALAWDRVMAAGRATGRGLRLLAGGPARLWGWLAARPVRALVAGIVLACGLRVPFLAVPFGADEGGYLYVAQQWPGPGHWLYGGQWVDRPPALVLVFKAVALLGGTTVAMRLVALALACVLVASAWYAGWRLAGRDGAVAAALSAAALGSDPAINGNQLASDGIGAMFVMASFALLLAALHRHERPGPGEASRAGRRAAVVLAGLAGTAGVLAFLSKQSAIVGMVVAALLLAARIRRRWPLLLAYATGVLVPLAATLAWAADGPGVAMFVNAIYTFRVASARMIADSASRAPIERLSTFLEVLVLSGLVLSLAHLGYDLLTRRRSWLLRGAVVVAALCLAGVITASVTWYPYYWLAVVPLAVIGMALAFVPAERRWRARLVPRSIVAGTVLVAVVNVVYRLPAEAAAPAVARFVAAASAPRDTMIVVWGQPNLLEDAGLRTPYPYSWSLPVRVEDPRLRLFARTLAGPDAPTWLLEAGRLDSWHMETPRVAEVVARRYHLAAVVCGHDILLRDGVRRPLAAGTEAASSGRC